MKKGLVRIIAGKWRGRRIKVPEEQDLRPTPDRVRETLFNWLMSAIPGAHCLDAFAGSGALGFEALSRGARQVVMIDQSHAVVKLLQEEAAEFGAENVSIYSAHLPNQLRPVTEPFDIVFLDPPYQSDLLLPCCHHLEDQHFLSASAYIYLEAQRVIEDNELPSTWRIIKSQKAGQVFYQLAQRELQTK